MRVSRVQAAENRERVINEASRQFRSHGFDGIGVKDLMKAAGMTQGAFYKQFASKEDLTVLASKRAMESATDKWAELEKSNPQDPLRAILDFYLGQDHLEMKMDGCPVVSLGSDAARQGAGVKASFEPGIKEYLSKIVEWIGEAEDEKTGPKAMTILSTMVGALLISRIVNDEEMATQFRQSAAESLLAGLTAGSGMQGQQQ
ncbi:TetR family transcriptional regulator [Sulfitobacter sp. EhC04]|uniref:TetR/AcrR family transcriptional regulator n=1 Tax=Sulfitobacter sp. EhC04 TaxID=1849168 RepID=UPI0007F49553|nr:TetR/AcrR family transcriptional regulator [Sulfitobacter sp. EhC04]OAN78635.1 TetR family transcriptional regulator [Sulfitobacter sp. EhC04]